MNKKGNGQLGLLPAPEISASGSPGYSGAQRERPSSPTRTDPAATRARGGEMRKGSTRGADHAGEAENLGQHVQQLE
ncbi:hypothetical protein ACFWVP_05020, partial [Streptomyces sp. NPDC058637]|uniref:hypothetical protein n=1 Tax=Streptomyces sp. NPDC058637 TaxID=3346569 RepID=UPI00364EE22E